MPDWPGPNEETGAFKIGAVIDGSDGAVTAAIAGATEPGEPAIGDTPGVGTGATELTPRLPISVESSGIRAPKTPPGVVDVEVGVEDAVTLFDPAPHIPDMPAVSNVPEGVAIPEPCIPEALDIPDDAEGKAAVPPAAAPVAGVELPGAIPAPSKVSDEPNMFAEEAPNVAQGMPLPGIAMVPVGLTGAGLVPGDVISVAPNGIPVPPTELPLLTSSGEVVPMDGVGMTMLCATAAWPARSMGKSTAFSESLTVILHSTIGLRGLNPSTSQRSRGSCPGFAPHGRKEG